MAPISEPLRLHLVTHGVTAEDLDLLTRETEDGEFSDLRAIERAVLGAPDALLPEIASLIAPDSELERLVGETRGTSGRPLQGAWAARMHNVYTDLLGVRLLARMREANPDLVLAGNPEEDIKDLARSWFLELAAVVERIRADIPPRPEGGRNWSVLWHPHGPLAVNEGLRLRAETALSVLERLRAAGFDPFDIHIEDLRLNGTLPEDELPAHRRQLEGLYLGDLQRALAARPSLTQWRSGQARDEIRRAVREAYENFLQSDFNGGTVADFYAEEAQRDDEQNASLTLELFTKLDSLMGGLDVEAIPVLTEVALYLHFVWTGDTEPQAMPLWDREEIAERIIRLVAAESGNDDVSIDTPLLCLYRSGKDDSEAREERLSRRIADLFTCFFPVDHLREILSRDGTIQALVDVIHSRLKDPTVKELSEDYVPGSILVFSRVVHGVLVRLYQKFFQSQREAGLISGPPTPEEACLQRVISLFSQEASPRMAIDRNNFMPTLTAEEHRLLARSLMREGRCEEAAHEYIRAYHAYWSGDHPDRLSALDALHQAALSLMAAGLNRQALTLVNEALTQATEAGFERLTGESYAYLMEAVQRVIDDSEKLIDKAVDAFGQGDLERGVELGLMALKAFRDLEAELDDLEETGAARVVRMAGRESVKVLYENTGGLGRPFYEILSNYVWLKVEEEKMREDAGQTRGDVSDEILSELRYFFQKILGEGAYVTRYEELGPIYIVVKEGRRWEIDDAYQFGMRFLIERIAQDRGSVPDKEQFLTSLARTVVERINKEGDSVRELFLSFVYDDTVLIFVRGSNQHPFPLEASSVLTGLKPMDPRPVSVQAIASEMMDAMEQKAFPAHLFRKSVFADATVSERALFGDLVDLEIKKDDPSIRRLVELAKLVIKEKSQGEAVRIGLALAYVLRRSAFEGSEGALMTYAVMVSALSQLATVGERIRDVELKHNPDDPGLRALVKKLIVMIVEWRARVEVLKGVALDNGIPEDVLDPLDPDNIEDLDLDGLVRDLLPYVPEEGGVAESKKKDSGHGGGSSGSPAPADGGGGVVSTGPSSAKALAGRRGTKDEGRGAREEDSTARQSIVVSRKSLTRSHAEHGNEMRGMKLSRGDHSGSEDEELRPSSNDRGRHGTGTSYPRDRDWDMPDPQTIPSSRGGPERRRGSSGARRGHRGHRYRRVMGARARTFRSAARRFVRV